jgi:cell division protein FtsB
MGVKNKLIEKIKSKIPKISKYLIYIMFILLSFSVYRNVSKIGSIYKKIAEKEANVKQMEEDNKALEKKVEEVTSNDYIEKQIRDKLGLAKEGEIVLVLPEPEVLKKFAPKIAEEEETLPDPNWKKWIKLFF